MRCPNCYGKVDRSTNCCTKCGFNVKSLENASNKKAKELIRSGDGDLVLYSNVLPSDLNKKSLLLYCGLLGLFGAHYFYVGRMFRGMLNLVTSVFSLPFATLFALGIELPKVFQYFDYFFGSIFVIILVLTIFDFVNIIFEKFKVPVYVDKKNKK